MLFWGDIGLDTNICFQNILKGNGSSCTVCFLIRPTSLWATEDKVKTAVLLGAECVLPTLQGTERTREEEVELTRRRDQDTHYNRNILVQQSALMLQMQKSRHRKVRWFASHHLRPKVRTKTQSFLLIHQLSNSKPCGIQTQQYYFFSWFYGLGLTWTICSLPWLSAQSDLGPRISFIRHILGLECSIWCLHSHDWNLGRNGWKLRCGKQCSICM